MRRIDKSIQSSHDDQQWNCYFLHYTQEAKGFQLFARLRLTCRPAAMSKCRARQFGQTLEVVREVISTSVRDSSFYPRLKSRFSLSIVSPHPNAHQPPPAHTPPRP